MFSAPGDHQPNGTIVKNGSPLRDEALVLAGQACGLNSPRSAAPTKAECDWPLSCGSPDPGAKFLAFECEATIGRVLQRDMSLERLADLQPAFAAGRASHRVCAHPTAFRPHPGRGFWLLDAKRPWAGLQRDMSLERLDRPAACIRRGSRLLQGVSASRCFCGRRAPGRSFRLVVAIGRSGLFLPGVSSRAEYR